MWVCLIWWMWVCAGGGIVLWVCLIWWLSGVGCGFVWFGGWFVLISVDVFFFFFEVCGSGCWWPLLPHGGWAGVGDEEDDDSDTDRE